MATLDRAQIIAALKRLGELAAADGVEIELRVVGGAAMVLGYSARDSTRDVDVAIVRPKDAAAVRLLASAVADELGWTSDWLNDAAKGFIVGHSAGAVVHDSPGIRVIMPATEQLLAMKLCAWRDDVDVKDARRLLDELAGDHDSVWQSLSPFLQKGRELDCEVCVRRFMGGRPWSELKISPQPRWFSMGSECAVWYRTGCRRIERSAMRSRPTRKITTSAHSLPGSLNCSPREQGNLPLRGWQRSVRLLETSTCSASRSRCPGFAQCVPTLLRPRFEGAVFLRR